MKRVHDGETLHNLSDVEPLLAGHDLEKAAETLRPEALQARAPNMWRYREVMPIRSESEIVSLGEGFTPLHWAERLGAWADSPSSISWTSRSTRRVSFKARGLSAAVTAARARGAKALAIPTAGNAGGALSAYAAACGLPAVVFMLRDTPSAFAIECRSSRRYGRNGGWADRRLW